MGEIKTKPTESDVKLFIDSVENEKKRNDSYAILEMMSEVTGEKPVLWGTSLIGFGKYHYKSKSGQEGDWFLTGFSPRKQNISLYLMAGYVRGEDEVFDDLMNKLGKYKTGAGCVYINKLEDVNVLYLKELIRLSVNFLKNKYPEK
ncbi:MAG: DUF1801 domain-containing protein [Bacteroidales bacterium]|nr:DUF1801 domain-containing protein [Bacteroidales bacterium]